MSERREDGEVEVGEVTDGAWLNATVGDGGGHGGVAVSVRRMKRGGVSHVVDDGAY